MPNNATTHRFSLNGATFTTDPTTVRVLRSLIPAARAAGDSSAVIAVLALGLQTGRITHVDGPHPFGGDQ